MPLNLSELSDMELENLHGNTIRLAQSGTQPQKDQAERLLPRIGQEIARRRKAHVVGVTRKREDALSVRRAKAKKSSDRKSETKKQ